MFSGIVEGIGKVKSIEKLGASVRLTVGTTYDVEDIKIGASIAVEGVCLTVVKKSKGVLSFDVLPETLRRSTLGALSEGSSVNLERSLKVSDRIDGHFVFGHVDGTARLRSRISEGKDSEKLVWTVSKEIRKFLATKGSVSVAGVSLTIGDLTPETFSVYLTPHTLKVTTLGSRKIGELANVEVDMLARYAISSGANIESGVCQATR